MEFVKSLDRYLAESKPTLVEFFSPRCSHCLAMMPVVEELRGFIGERANIVQVNCEDTPELREKYDIYAYPTWILFKDGQQAWRDMGEKPESELEEMVRKFV